jgi:hypothetical protein
MVNLPIEYSDKPATPFGGMALMKHFIDQTDIREHLATLDLPQGGSNRTYDPVQICSAPLKVGQVPVMFRRLVDGVVCIG